MNKTLKTIVQKIFQWQRSELAVVLLIGHLVFFSVLGLRSIGILQNLELATYDLMLWTQSIALPVDQRISMVWITDEDQRAWGWPLPDEHLASLLQIILAQDPVAIGLDLYRDLPVPRIKGSGYEYLMHVYRNYNNVIGIKKFESQGVHVDPPPVLRDKQFQVGFNDIPADPHAILRRGLLYIGDEQGNTSYFYGLILALHYLGPLGIGMKPHPDNERGTILGETELIPIDKNFGGYVDGDMDGFQIMLNYPGAPGKFNSISVTRVLLGEFDPNIFKDKIVIIGANAEATPDFLYTPFGYLSHFDNRVPGASVHAFFISQLLRMGMGVSKPLETWNEAEEILWIWLWGILGAAVCLWARSILRFSLSLIGGLMLLAFFCYLAFINNFWILFAAPSISWVLSIALMVSFLSNQEKNQRTELMHLFSKHVSKEVAEVIWKERNEYLNAGRLRPQRLIASVLFTDLQNFTTVSEQMEPQELMDWLNQYMETMVSVVEKKHHGQVNKFIGDAIMAVFGVPLPRNTPEEVFKDAENAVECALSMREEIIRLRKVWQQAGLPLIRMRVGICTGIVVSGSLGGIERQEYTVLGDTVNIASRLESFDKNVDAENPCRILISQTTLECLQNRFVTEFIGDVNLKGKVSKVIIYNVIGHAETGNGIEKPAISIYHQNSLESQT